MFILRRESANIIETSIVSIVKCYYAAIDALFPIFLINLKTLHVIQYTIIIQFPNEDLIVHNTDYFGQVN